MRNIPIALLVPALAGCYYCEDPGLQSLRQSGPDSTITSIVNIPLPDGFQRLEQPPRSFGCWLRNIRLKKDRRVYLYDGTEKQDQSVQYAVVDITTGRKNLQQCADAAMRLRAEYLFHEKRFNEIEFRDNNNTLYKWNNGNNREGFESYLERVFGMCGSASLAKQLPVIRRMKDIHPGDILIRGGFPGHAMVVLDVAINSQGERIFLLAQGFMPAQDMHIVINPGDRNLSPWYKVADNTNIITPNWTFYPNELKGWQ